MYQNLFFYVVDPKILVQHIGFWTEEVWNWNMQLTQDFSNNEVAIGELNSLLELLYIVSPNREFNDKHVWWMGGAGFLVARSYDVLVSFDQSEGLVDDDVL